MREIGRANNIYTGSIFDILVALFEKKGMELFKIFRGRFSFVLIDKCKHCVYACKDFIGSMALYYFESYDAFYITSNASNLLSLTEINYDYLNDLLAGRRIVGCDSAFCNVNCVPVGCVLVISDEQIYFRKLNHEIPIIKYKNEDEYYEHFNEILKNVLKKNISQNVGFTISGGLDCTLLAYIYSKFSPEIEKGFTFDLDCYGKSSEELYIKEISKDEVININHVKLEHRFLENIIKKVYDEPNYYVLTNAWNIMLKQCSAAGISSVVTGFGGDEITVGYDYINDLNFFNRYKEAMLLAIHGKSKIIQKRENTVFPSMIDKRFHNVDVSGGSNLSNSVKKLYMRLFSGEIGRLIYRYEQDCFEDFSMNLIVPFLDQDLITFSLGLPVDIHARNGSTKRIQRKLGHSILPPIIEKRKSKSDFFYWFIAELDHQQNFVKTIIEESRLVCRGYNFVDIHDIYNQYYDGYNSSFQCRKELANKIMDFISVEIWLRNLEREM